ncbi:MAG TPA: response regulator [Bryobacteraceae bacterium]|nr:response regulator [Bryobacteraceae bacterium]
MSRILLVDHSPHAQRMGERILTDEGYEVVTVSNADSALIRLEDVDPDVVVADASMSPRSGYEICQYVKMSPRHRYVRVLLTAGILETFDEEQVRRVEADGTLQKPFEATALVEAVKPLAEAAVAARAELGNMPAGGPAADAANKALPGPFVVVVDAEQVRAAVTVALDASMTTIIDEVTRRVLAAFNAKKQDTHAAEPPPVRLRFEAARTAPPQPAPPAPAPPPPATPRFEAVRRISPIRPRSGSILGLEISRPEPRPMPSDTELESDSEPDSE